MVGHLGQNRFELLMADAAQHLGSLGQVVIGVVNHFVCLSGAEAPWLIICWE